MPKFDDLTIQSIFGHEAAEDEQSERLREYYFKNRIFDRVTAPLPLRILVGHKGIGKSAMFKVAFQEDKEKGFLPIWIRPDDVIDIAQPKADFNQLVRDWKIGLTEIITRKVLTSLGYKEEEVKQHSSHLREYGSKLVSVLIETALPTLEEKVPLDPARKALISNFVRFNRIIVYIDDLDRGWQGKKEDVLRISALLNALRDLANDNKPGDGSNNGKGIYFKVALRADVFFLYRTSDESTDKIENAVVWLSWTNHEILALLAKRVLTYQGQHRKSENDLLAMRQPILARYLSGVMEDRFRGAGIWENIPTYRMLMTLIRRRPRDLVKLCSLAAQNAESKGRTLITTDDFNSIFADYSQGRLQDTFNEYRSELPDIDKLIMNMKPSRSQMERRKKEREQIPTKSQTGTDSLNKRSLSLYIYTTDEILKKIENIRQGHRFRLANGKEADAKQLLQFMYKINFLTARKELPSGEIQRLFFEENRYVSGEFADFGYAWEIHPAYRWALQPDRLDKVLEDLAPSADD